MKWSLLVFVAIVTAPATIFVNSKHTKEEFRDGLCAKDDPEIFQKLDSCFAMETEKTRRYARSCMVETSPSGADTIVKFWTEVCKNKTIFDAFDICFMKHHDELMKEMRDDDPAAICDEALLEE